MAYTKEQMRVYQKEYYQKNRENILVKNQQWKAENKEQFLKKCKEYRDNHRKKYTMYRAKSRKKTQLLAETKWEVRLRRHVNSARARAKKAGIPFDISVEDLSLPEVCPVLGIPFDLAGPRSKASPSLDRLNPSLGYIKGNVFIISDLANRMKQEATREELEAFAANISAYVSLRDNN